LQSVADGVELNLAEERLAGDFRSDIDSKVFRERRSRCRRDRNRGKTSGRIGRDWNHPISCVRVGRTKNTRISLELF